MRELSAIEISQVGGGDSPLLLALTVIIGIVTVLDQLPTLTEFGEGIGGGLYDSLNGC